MNAVAQLLDLSQIYEMSYKEPRLLHCLGNGLKLPAVSLMIFTKQSLESDQWWSGRR
jgi:hypothetical protein